jgi:hypothetical protein
MPGALVHYGVMQVVVKQFSGLGNQLFQYAAGRYYANHLGASLRVAIEQQHRARSLDLFDRPMLLSRFCVEAPLTPLSLADRLLLSRNTSLQRTAAPVARTFKILTLREAPTQQHTFLEPPSIPSLRTLYVDGYWQTHTFADGVSTQLRREFQLRDAPPATSAVVLQRIRSTESPVSVHVRRGDYALLHGGRLVLPVDYYRRAIEHIRSNVANPVLFVFSDDVEYARTVLPRDVETVYVEGNGDFAAHEDLRLMSACKAHIIANSSFSWWGAWLNPAERKLVIAPKHWERTAESYYPHLCPPGWLLLDTAE